MWAFIVIGLVAIVTLFVAGTVQLGIGETVLGRLTGLVTCLLAALCFIIFIQVVQNVMLYSR